MRIAGSEIASICLMNKPFDKDIPAHLVHRDSVRDFAIFCLDSEQSPPPLHLDLKVHFPAIDKLDFETHLANRRAFAIGYNSLFRAADFPRARHEVINNLSPLKQSQAQSLTLLDSDFYKVLRPDCKTLSIGRLHSQPPDGDKTIWKHRITGWYGISGAMIACLDQSSGEAATLQVLGICKTTPLQERPWNPSFNVLTGAASSQPSCPRQQ